MSQSRYQNMNVEALRDILGSQYIVFDNKALLVQGEGAEPVHLFAGDALIASCLNYEEADIDEVSIKSVLGALRDLDPETPILCSSEERLQRGFQIGFRSKEEGFVETINSTELVEHTHV